MITSCWNPKWVLPFESAWSIIEKYKAANRISSTDFLDAYALAEYKNKRGFVSKSYRELYSFKAMNQEEFTREIGVSILDYQSDAINQIGSRLPSGTNIQYFRDYLAYCPVCIQNGFHSVLHQFSLLHHCPYHQVDLQKGCQDCGERIPYEISTRKTGGLRNKCICVIDYPSDFNSWTNERPITCPKMSKLFKLDDRQINRIKTMLLMPNMDPDQVEYLLDLILNWIDTGYIEKPGFTHVKSSKNILQNRNVQYDQLIEGLSKTIHPMTPEHILLEKRAAVMNDFINQEIRSVITSSAKHLREKLLYKHRSCTRRITNLNQSWKIGRVYCPHSLAYLYWRKYIDSLDDICDVDRFSKPYTKYVEGFKFKNVYTAFQKWAKLHKDYTTVNPVGITWLIKQVVGRELLRLFNEYLLLATDNTEGEPVGYKPLELSMKNMICIIPIDVTEAFEFIAWDQEEANPIPICPYNSVMKRRYTLREKEHQEARRYTYYF